MPPRPRREPVPPPGGVEPGETDTGRDGLLYRCVRSRNGRNKWVVEKTTHEASRLGGVLFGATLAANREIIRASVSGELLVGLRAEEFREVVEGLVGVFMKLYPGGVPLSEKYAFTSLAAAAEAVSAAFASAAGGGMWRYTAPAALTNWARMDDRELLEKYFPGGPWVR